ncbi:glycoside hydrolase family 3 protein [Pilimelia columellifera]
MDIGGRLRRLRPLTALALVAALASCSVAESRLADPQGAAPSAPPPAPSVSLPGLDRFSDADLVGQVLMPYAYGSSATAVSAGSVAGNQRLAGVDTPAQMIARYRLGGLILVGFSADDPTAASQPTSNVDSAPQVRELTRGLQAAAGQLPARAPLLVGVDQEYGVVRRIEDKVTALPSAMAFGAAANPALTRDAWRAAGVELSALGVNMDFAPVADVLGDGPGGAIGSRSYGAEPAAVAQQVGAAVQGLQAAGVAAVVKHFPGHGHTVADSHHRLPRLAQTRAELARDDLPPFVAGLRAQAWAVMSGHLDVRAVDPGVPASFSSKVLNGLLREQLGFTGVVVTDALNMAPAQRWPAPEAALRALLAGNDLLLMPDQLPAVHAALLAALGDGRLPRPRLVQAVGRILELKRRLTGRPQPGMDVLGAVAHQRAVAALDRAAVTALRGPCGSPIRGPVTVTAAKGREAARDRLITELRATGATVTDSGGIVVHLVGYGDTAADLRSDAHVTVAMDTPYVLASARSPVLLATYSSTPLAMAALAAVLVGRLRPTGRAPVQVGPLARGVC